MLVTALLEELRLRKDYLGDETVETIYLGGGTPSLCSTEELKNILRAVYALYKVSGNAEVTIEVNPDDISPASLNDWKEMGINRLSIGIQSFHQEDLEWMNRAHTAGQAIDSLQLAKRYFDNISVDLIYGTPSLTNEKWKENVDRVTAAGIPHISCYALTVEPKTPLDKMIRQKLTSDVSTDQQAEQFLLLMEWLRTAGYEHYEISNFSLLKQEPGSSGWRSRHNTSYWQGKNYLGIGPSAHSFDGNSRQWNISNNARYIESLTQQKVPFESEVLTEKQKRNEYVMTALRTAEGIDTRVTGPELSDRCHQFIDAGFMVKNANRLVLTDKGKLMADGIASELFD